MRVHPVDGREVRCTAAASPKLAATVPSLLDLNRYLKALRYRLTRPRRNRLSGGVGRTQRGSRSRMLGWHVVVTR